MSSEEYGRYMADLIYGNHPKHRDGPFEGLPNHENFWEQDGIASSTSPEFRTQRVRDLEELLKYAPTLAQLLKESDSSK